MKPNFYEETQKSVAGTILDVQKAIASDFKGTKEYGQEEIPIDQLYFSFAQLTSIERDSLYQRHGEKWIDFLYRMKKYEGRRNLRW